VVLGADTVVALGDEVLGKPRDAPHALETLTRLRGATHEVHTGACIVDADGGVRDFVVTTAVDFWPAPMAMVQAYAESEEVLDKAGAYGIQGRGAFLVKAVRGSYTNVVGLPLAEVLEVFESLGI
jgi:septum formation protein